MIFISDRTIEEFIQEDVPYLDLTTQALGIGDRPGKMTFTTRDRTMLCCTEEAGRILHRTGAHVTSMLATGETVDGGVTFLVAEGRAGALHLGWKAAQNLLEYACGVATQTAQLVKLAREVNPNIMVYTTRKHVPGTKPVAVKAILAGGAYPHRLGLSETVLIFEQHLNFTDGIEGLISQLSGLKQKVKEKKAIVEVKEISQAIELVSAGVDGIQFDKVDASAIAAAIHTLKSIDPAIVTLAAGGIHEGNIQDYAVTAVDGLVLSAPYYAKPADIKVEIVPD